MSIGEPEMKAAKAILPPPIYAALEAVNSLLESRDMCEANDSRLEYVKLFMDSLEEIVEEVRW